MCVIIHKPAGVAFPEKDIRLANQNNPHGFGYVYYDPQKDRLICKKSTEWTEDEIVAIFESLVDYEAVIHFRYRTQGAQTTKECHPFRVTSTKYQQEDIFFAHNGTISGLTPKDKDESDTQAFNRIILKPLLKDHPDLLEEYAFQVLLDDFIGASKLCFMYGQGNVVIINEGAGAQRAGCWVSNEYSFRHNYRNSNLHTGTTTTTYNRPNTGYTGGYQGNKIDKVKFVDQEVSVGSKVLVSCSADNSYWEDGTIDEINMTCTFVKFMGRAGKEERIAFYNQSGLSYLQNGYYVAYPIDGNVASKEESKEESKVVNMDDFKGEKKTQPEGQTETTKRTSATTSSDTPMTPVTEQEALTTNGLSGKPEDREGLMYQPVSHKNVTLDASDRWGGAFADQPNSYWGVTFRDIVNMTYQQRFEFFLDHLEVAFMMFQDALEYVAMDEDDYEDVEFYEVEEDDEDEHSVEASRR